MLMPQDVGGSYGFWFKMHFILLDTLQDRVVKQITSWSLLSVCLSPWLHLCLWPVVKVTRPVVGGDSSPRCGKDDGRPLPFRRSIYALLIEQLVIVLAFCHY